MNDDRTVDFAAAPVVLAHRSRCRACGRNMRRWSTAFRVAGGVVHARCRGKLERYVDMETGEIVERRRF